MEEELINGHTKEWWEAFATFLDREFTRHYRDMIQIDADLRKLEVLGIRAQVTSLDWIEVPNAKQG